MPGGGASGAHLYTRDQFHDKPDVDRDLHDPPRSSAGGGPYSAGGPPSHQTFRDDSSTDRMGGTDIQEPDYVSGWVGMDHARDMDEDMMANLLNVCEGFGKYYTIHDEPDMVSYFARTFGIGEDVLHRCNFHEMLAKVCRENYANTGIPVIAICDTYDDTYDTRADSPFHFTLYTCDPNSGKLDVTYTYMTLEEVLIDLDKHASGSFYVIADNGLYEFVETGRPVSAPEPDLLEGAQV
ncbi:hypothetical protein T484DRAFT_1757863 [Baffinella frigidus]|nr:hypothetical protein T484DRAFT_1757863 [Cryptophyta sp. CCMP2293]